MWRPLFAPPEETAGYSEYLRESMESIFRKIIVACSGLYGMVLLYFMLGEPGRYNWRLLPVCVWIVLVMSAAYWLIPRRFAFAQCVWLGGMTVALADSAVFFGRPEILFLTAFLPMGVVISLGWIPSLFSEAFLLGLILLFYRVGGQEPLPIATLMEIAAAGFIGQVIGWAFGSSMLAVVRWALLSYREARANLEEVRRHGGSLARLMKDLDQAYYRLERTNEALTMAWRKADEAERLKSEFVLNVSHELRTPLNLIIGFSEVISRSPESYQGAKLPKVYRRDINAIYNSARHLLGLIDDVLDLGRIEAEKIALVRTDVSLAALVEEVVAMVRDYVGAKGLELQVAVDPQLPPLWIDGLRVRQALLNLLANATRFTQHGFIRLEAVRRGTEVMVRVQDSGPGIPEADLAHVFDLFHSAGGAPEQKWHSGAGLGLPISKKFIEMHGGRMGVESAPGHGATFWFTLPLRGTAGSPAGISALSETAPPDWAARSMQKVLVAVKSDSRELAGLQRRFGEYRIIGAKDAAEAESLARESRALAILADEETAGQIRNGGFPVIQFSWPETLLGSVPLGAAGFLAKPVSAADLQKAVEGAGRLVRRILIADQDPELVRLFQRILRGTFPAEDCLEAFNLEEVLERAAVESPDLILMDLTMLQKEDGRLAGLSEFPALQGIPVVLISDTGEEDLELRFPGPIQAFRPEGFTPEEVVAGVTALLNALPPGWQKEPVHSPEPSG